MKDAERKGALVLFPGALGDFICALPAVLALHARHGDPLTLVARPSLLDLVDLPGAAGVAVDRREIADLFAAGAPLRPGTRTLLGGRAAAYSWSGFGDSTFARRLAEIAGDNVHVYPFRDLRPGEHAVEYYARCAGVVPQIPPTTLFRSDGAFIEAAPLARGPLLVVQPGSGSRAKNWQGFAALLSIWRAQHGGTAVVLRGPVEEDTAVGVDLGQPTLVGLSLPQATALLRRAAVYLGNDAGISHLAGVLGTATVALFGDSDPRTWAPRGPRVRVLHAPETCPVCSPGVLCVHRLPVERVLHALEVFV
ncbi:hypothetical protein L6Q96_18725 [Candidatus Binatia bacterium]|nr:hypothetical protein [Candidatus Binatia bacterium]